MAHATAVLVGRSGLRWTGRVGAGGRLSAGGPLLLGLRQVGQGPRAVPGRGG